MIKKACHLLLDVCALVRFSPHLLVLKMHSSRLFLHKEAAQWVQAIRHRPYSNWKDLLWLLRFLPEYRSVLYLRLGVISNLLRIIAPPQVALYITRPSSNIGCGLVIQHGHSTRIGPHSIGDNCHIWQNVTIGKKEPGSSAPIIGNNVRIFAGAVVVGDITIGDNTTIGALAFVSKSIPPNTIVVGGAHRIIQSRSANVRVE